MRIFIGGKPATLKTGTSFEYVSENRMFSGADGYTLSMSFPLRDCKPNLEIFGHVNRQDVIAGKLVYDCVIQDRGFSKYGTAVITEINEAEVKAQFLEGRSEQNFDTTFEDVYVNELDLGEPPKTSPADIAPAKAWQPWPSYLDPQCVALPWVNDYSGNIQNLASCVVDDETQGKYHYEWDAENTPGLSWQPYLLHLTKKICEAVGYECDLSAWEESEEHRWLLVCNTLPYAWDMPGFANALPRWTVDEYFEKLELFLGGEFEFDHRGKKLTFAFTDDILAAAAPVRLEDVVYGHTVEVTAEDPDCDYLEAKNLAYKECDHEMWKYYSCDWFVKGWRNNVVSYAMMTELLADNEKYARWTNLYKNRGNVDKLLYAADVDTYFHLLPYKRQWGAYYRFRLRPMNLFGPRVVDASDDAGGEGIEFVPAWIDDTDDTYGRVLFLSFGSWDGDEEEEDEEDNPFIPKKTLLQTTLEEGEEDETAEYYDVVYVGFWDGSQDTSRKLPHPDVEDIAVEDDMSNYRNLRFSLRLTGGKTRRSKTTYTLDPTMKATFKFLADAIPDVRALFYIKGKRYVCEKITATFTEDGMSRLLKGVFWPLAD